MRDATGSKGTKQFSKWIGEMQKSSDTTAETMTMPQKMNKLAYVIVRLLQNAW